MEMNGQFHGAAALPLEKVPRYLFNRGCVNTRVRSTLDRREKISCPCWEFNHELLFMCLVTIYLQDQKFSVSISNCFGHILINSMTNIYLLL